MKLPVWDQPSQALTAPAPAPRPSGAQSYSRAPQSPSDLGFQGCQTLAWDCRESVIGNHQFEQGVPGLGISSYQESLALKKAWLGARPNLYPPGFVADSFRYRAASNWLLTYGKSTGITKSYRVGCCDERLRTPILASANFHFLMWNFFFLKNVDQFSSVAVSSCCCQNTFDCWMCWKSNTRCTCVPLSC